MHPLVARIVGWRIRRLRMERVAVPAIPKAVEVIREEGDAGPALVDLFIEYHTLFEVCIPKRSWASRQVIGSNIMPSDRV